MSRQINVMIVDDALMIRAILKSIIESDPEKRFKVIASARDGNDALEKLEQFEIDVITMDVEMPNKNGIEALREIMRKKPTPVIMFSSLTKKGAKETTEALLLGAVSFMTKPSTQNEISNKELRQELYTKLVEAAVANKQNIRSSIVMEDKINRTDIKKPTPKSIRANVNEKLTNLIAIGTSTGGPTALQKILSKLPSDLKAGIVIVQHMPPGGYTASLAEHLNQLSDFHVKEAEDGDEVIDGNVYIAPGGLHMELFKRGNKIQIVLNKREQVSGHRPSVDTMFVSIARAKIDIPVYAAVLTGMGRDGTNGSQALKREGATILAESEKTSVIFGMPKQVILQGLADYVEDLEKIIPKIKELTR